MNIKKLAAKAIKLQKVNPRVARKMAMKVLDLSRKAASLVVLDDDALEEIQDTPEGKKWKGYEYDVSFSTVTFIGDEGDYDEDHGWESQGEGPFDTLDELLSSAEGEGSWIEWSSSSPSKGDWIISEGEQSGDENTTYNLFIKRKDKKGLEKEEIKFISDYLRI